jgi:uracil-DNA glycosylase family 4
MDITQQKYLQAMGIELWEERKRASDVKTSNTEIVGSIQKKQSVKTTHPVATEAWDVLEKKALSCTLCDLCKTRTKVVFGAGNRQAELMLVGEAPGASEDIQGLPFVGRAGLLLTAILQSVGLEREEIYITNILKCRPPNNRDPFPREIDCCTPYLKRQIALIQPKLIVAVGRIAAQFLLDTKESLSYLRGKKHRYAEQEAPLVITYHPAYLLRSPKEKAKAYEDWLWIRQLLDAL